MTPLYTASRFNPKKERKEQVCVRREKERERTREEEPENERNKANDSAEGRWTAARPLHVHRGHRRCVGDMYRGEGGGGGIPDTQLGVLLEAESCT